MGLRGVRSQPIGKRRKRPAIPAEPSDIPPLTPAELSFLMYGLEDGPDSCPFPDETAARAAWELHKGQMLSDFPYAGTGRRPLAFWLLDRGERPPPFDRERSTLFELGLLESDEAKALVARWRRHWEEAQQPGFHFMDGDGRMHTGQRARWKQYAYFDVPRTLRERWEAEAPSIVPRPA
jgi:hypothetical protein